jgi:hypothetical protein
MHFLNTNIWFFRFHQTRTFAEKRTIVFSRNFLSYRLILCTGYVTITDDMRTLRSNEKRTRRCHNFNKPAPAACLVCPWYPISRSRNLHHAGISLKVTYYCTVQGPVELARMLGQRLKCYVKPGTVLVHTIICKNLPMSRDSTAWELALICQCM